MLRALAGMAGKRAAKPAAKAAVHPFFAKFSTRAPPECEAGQAQTPPAPVPAGAAPDEAASPGITDSDTSQGKLTPPKPEAPAAEQQPQPPPAKPAKRKLQPPPPPLADPKPPAKKPAAKNAPKQPKAAKTPASPADAAEQQPQPPAKPAKRKLQPPQPLADPKPPAKKPAAKNAPKQPKAAKTPTSPADVDATPPGPPKSPGSAGEPPAAAPPGRKRAGDHGDGGEAPAGKRARVSSGKDDGPTTPAAPLDRSASALSRMSSVGTPCCADDEEADRSSDASQPDAKTAAGALERSATLQALPDSELEALKDQAVADLWAHLTEPGWKNELAGEAEKTYFRDLALALKRDREKYTVFPPEADVFASFNEAPFEDVKAVIIGQDPYHGENQAHGLCFSVLPGRKPPPSLKNMYKELVTDVDGFAAPAHGYLIDWARQGILMLNATLTVRAHEANSHAKMGWQTFTDAAIRVLSEKRTGIVFLLWGGFAHKKGKIIANADDVHRVVHSFHPSPLSWRKWTGCKTFSKANEALAELGKEPIVWHLPPEVPPLESLSRTGSSSSSGSSGSSSPSSNAESS
ncbi:Uracil-DNA glycosylase [Diplonema papillatum]|nr:Uracil-DNA glycosylase [Diplonema papillatum]